MDQPVKWPAENQPVFTTGQRMARRDFAKLGGGLLAATAWPAGVHVQGQIAAGEGSRPEITPPTTPNSYQLEGIAGRTADLGNGYYLNPILAGDYTPAAEEKLFSRISDIRDSRMKREMMQGEIARERQSQTGACK